MSYTNAIKFLRIETIDEYTRCLYFSKMQLDIFHDEYDTVYNQDFRIFVTIPATLMPEIKANVENAINRNCFYVAQLELKQAIKNEEISYSTYLELTDFDLNKFADYECYVEQLNNDLFIKHNYWQMQLHPNDDNWVCEKDLLKNYQMIGLSTEINDKIALHNFEENMEQGDIVLIRHGANPIALVEVSEDKLLTIPETNNVLWFDMGRRIKVLEYWQQQANCLYYTRGALKKSINPTTPTYTFIDNWYRKTVSMPLKEHCLQINAINITNYKMFDNFNMKTIDSKDSPLPVVVIAGNNGCGKSTLLSMIYNLLSNNKDDCIPHIDLAVTIDNKPSHINSEHLSNSYKNLVAYYPIDFDKTDKLKKLLIAFVEKRIFDDHMSIDAANEELASNINEILSNLDCNFSFFKIDGKKEVLFKNKARAVFPMDGLSTGELVILGKIIKLYIANLRGKIVLIDEPEISMHPNWQANILKIYHTFAILNKCQIFIATHSPQIIMSAYNGWVKVLDYNNDSTIHCFDNNNTYGNELYEILHNIMGSNYDRAPDVQQQLNSIRKKLEEPSYTKEQISKDIKALESEIGNCIEIQFLKLETDTRFNHD